MKQYIQLRQKIHQNPELSGQEQQTREILRKFLGSMNVDEVLELGVTGIAFIYHGASEGKCIVFRAELDALPIQEVSELDYKSGNKGVSHACGHDGHMAILAGLAGKIVKNPPKSGRVILLFQPAEETGQGAREIMENPRFRELNPDYVFALHNIPGIPLHEVIIREGPFAAASSGMVITLMGKSSHAGEPEQGINPDRAISKIIKAVHALNEKKSTFSDVAFATVIHLILGEIAFGTSPGYGEVRLTLRAYENRDLELLSSMLESLVSAIAAEEQLEHTISYAEEFPATVNYPDCVAMVDEAARGAGFPVRTRKEPFRWSEDFGYYTMEYPGGFFGLGSGPDHPALHHPDYNFPDELIATGIDLFYQIYRNLQLKDLHDA